MPKKSNAAALSAVDLQAIVDAKPATIKPATLAEAAPQPRKRGAAKPSQAGKKARVAIAARNQSAVVGEAAASRKTKTGVGASATSKPKTDKRASVDPAAEAAPQSRKRGAAKPSQAGKKARVAIATRNQSAVVGEAAASRKTQAGVGASASAKRATAERATVKPAADAAPQPRKRGAAKPSQASKKAGVAIATRNQSAIAGEAAAVPSAASRKTKTGLRASATSKPETGTPASVVPAAEAAPKTVKPQKMKSGTIKAAKPVGDFEDSIPAEDLAALANVFADDRLVFDQDEAALADIPEAETLSGTPPRNGASKVARAKTATGRLARPKPEVLRLRRGAKDVAMPERRREPWEDLVVVPKALELKEKRRKRVIAYLRYSSHIQTVQSLIRQAELLREYCIVNNFDLILMLKDEATSGTIENREGLEAAIKLIAEGKADILLAEDCDRFARKHTILPNLFDRLKGMGAQLWTITKGHIANGMMANLLGAMAADDREKTVDRFAAGKRIAVRRGRIPIMPFGYVRIAPGVWAIDEEQARIVRLIFDLYLKDVSMAFIATHLNSRNVPSPRGGKWVYTVISKILENPVYAGVYLFGRKRGWLEHSGHETIVVKIPDLAIVSREDWAAVRAKAKLRAKSIGPKRQHFTYDFLSKRIWCPLHGRPMTFLYKAIHSELFCLDEIGVRRRSTRVPLEPVRSAVLDAIERRIVTPEGDAVFSAERAAARERERKLFARQRVSLGLKLADANNKADASLEDDWMPGASEERRMRRREVLEANVTALQDEIAELRRRERIQEDGALVRETLKSRFARLRAEGVPADGSESSFDIVHALRSVLVRVDVTADPENRWFDVATVLAPNGDAEFALKPPADLIMRLDDEPEEAQPAPEVETITETTRVYLRSGRRAGDPFVLKVTEALDRGWLAISEPDYRRIAERTPALQALPSNWPIDRRIALLRAMLAIGLTSLPVTLIDAVGRSGCRSKFYVRYVAFLAQGGVAQLRRALDALAIRGLPAFAPEDLELDRRDQLVVKWSPDW